MSETNTYVMCIISAPEEIAEALADKIIKQRLAACAQVTTRIKSFYWWNEQVNVDPEILIYLKTLKTKIPAINHLLKEMHPYEVPEFIVLPILDGNPAYLAWIDDNVI